MCYSFRFLQNWVLCLVYSRHSINNHLTELENAKKTGLDLGLSCLIVLYSGLNWPMAYLFLVWSGWRRVCSISDIIWEMLCLFFHIQYAVSFDFLFCQNAFSLFQLEFKQNNFRQHPRNIWKHDISGLFSPSALKKYIQL